MSNVFLEVLRLLLVPHDESLIIEWQPFWAYAPRQWNLENNSYEPAQMKQLSPIST